MCKIHRWKRWFPSIGRKAEKNDTRRNWPSGDCEIYIVRWRLTRELGPKIFLKWTGVTRNVDAGREVICRARFSRIERSGRIKRACCDGEKNLQEGKSLLAGAARRRNDSCVHAWVRESVCCHAARRRRSEEEPKKILSARTRLAISVTRIGRTLRPWWGYSVHQK